MYGRNRFRLGLLAILALFNYLVWVAVSEAINPPLRIDFLAVGQGDAVLIRTPSGQNILVDGGPDDKVLAELGKILPVWDRELDLIVATHPEADHITGLLAVLRRYRVNEVLTPLWGKSTRTYQEWQNSLFQVSQINYADAADDYQWGEVFWDTLLPLSSMDSHLVGNDASIVAQLIYRKYYILLTADIGTPAEMVLQQVYPSLNSQILKVAHHGSRFSSGGVFLQSVQPQVAVISVGVNSYGHPHPDTMGRLQAVGADIYRTDQDDTIEMIFRDNGYWVKTRGQKKFYPN